MIEFMVNDDRGVISSFHCSSEGMRIYLGLADQVSLPLS